MLRLPIFLILLLVLSPAAGIPVESELQRDLTQESAKDLGMETEHLLSRDGCCRPGNTSCCGRK
nr:conotoxin precursor T [Conus judaeus]UMA83545.1 conotoxin precursor T [Conus judaeus]